jgi:hypothetical protein
MVAHAGRLNVRGNAYLGSVKTPIADTCDRR